MLSYGLHPQGVQTIFDWVCGGMSLPPSSPSGLPPPSSEGGFFIGSLFEGAAELARLREFTPSVSPSASHLPRRGRLFHWLPLTRELSAALPLTEGETGVRALGQGVRPFRIGGVNPSVTALCAAPPPLSGEARGREIRRRTQPKRQRRRQSLPPECRRPRPAPGIRR